MVEERFSRCWILRSNIVGGGRRTPGDGRQNPGDEPASRTTHPSVPRAFSSNLEKRNSPKFGKKVPNLAHLRDAPTWIGEHDTVLVSPAASDTPSYPGGLRPD